MPVKQKRPHHTVRHKERRSKRFLKTYAPYIPLMMIVGFGIFLSVGNSEFNKLRGNVLAYATNMTDPGLLDSTNKARTNNGLEPLKFNPILDQAAQAKAEDMAKRDYWSHNTPDGQEPWVFIDAAGYEYFKAAENLAYGFNSSNSAVVGWMNSPSHRANILDGDLKEVGFGIANVENYQGKGPETIVVAMYGLPSPLATTTASLGAGQGESEVSLNQPTAAFASTAAPAETKNISYAQMLTGGVAPWITLVIGIAIGLMVMYLVLKHTRNIFRAVHKGEQFIMHHPVLDMTIVATLAVATIVAQTAGVIH